MHRRAWQAHLGVIWNPLQPVNMDVAWVMGRRETLAAEHGDMNRLNFWAKYSFN